MDDADARQARCGGSHASSGTFYHDMHEAARNLVLGGGLLGCGIALELAAASRPVLLIEQDASLMNRASLRNEGKIHLGLIFAADRTGQTGRFQLQGAMSFQRIVSSWIGAAAFSRVGVSTPFTYLVACDSLLSPDALQRHYDDLERALDAIRDAEGEDIDYLGGRLPFLARRTSLAAAEPFVATSPITAAFETTERAISPEQLADEIRQAVGRHPLIDVRCDARVVGLEPHDRGLAVDVEMTPTRDRHRFTATAVFNAAWDQRRLLDGFVGIQPEPGWLHRLKYRVIASVPPGLEDAPSATMVLGRYGDVVIRPDDTAYLSWYPEALRGWSHEVAPPADWTPACKGTQSAATTRPIAAAIIRGIAAWYPAFAGSEVLAVDAGAIVACGATDVDVADSGLHTRAATCFRRNGVYWSVDAGKLTTAPLVARQVVGEFLRGEAC